VQRHGVFAVKAKTLSHQINFGQFSSGIYCH